jgi:pyridoxine 5-phosphate synthase
MNKLGVNIDHVATVRQARGADEPDPAWAAVEAQLGGADCITIHLREDRRHIQDRDVAAIQQVTAVKFNLEMSMQAEIVEIAIRTRPTQCTLVPERREELTTEGGLDVARYANRAAEVVRTLRDSGIITSAFIEPIEDQLRASKDAGFDAVELWTGGYAHATRDDPAGDELQRLARAAELGWRLGLTVHAGHGLTYRNVAPVAALRIFDEFNIGHSIVSRAIFTGMSRAVREMKELLGTREDAPLPPSA